MKCVAKYKCQTRLDDGRRRTFEKGDVWDFKVCPIHFNPIEGKEAMPIDFDKAQEQELLETDFDLDELKTFIETKYDRKAGNRGKEKTIEMLLDCRYREINTDLDKVL